MSSSAIKVLKSLEKEFSAIRGLMAEVNEVGAGTIFTDRIASDQFRFYSMKWDQWEDPNLRKLLLKELDEESGIFLSKKILGMMQGLVLIRRYAKEARNEQQRHKAHILSLMKRLHQQAMAAHPSGKLPSFSFPEVQPLVQPAPSRPMRLKKLKKTEAKLLHQLFEAFELKRLPAEAKLIFRRLLNDSLLLAGVGIKEEKKWKKRIGQLKKASNKARVKGKNRLADAYSSLLDMYRVRLKLEASVREMMGAKHAKWLFELQEFVVAYAHEED